MTDEEIRAEQEKLRQMMGRYNYTYNYREPGPDYIRIGTSPRSVRCRLSIGRRAENTPEILG